MSERICRNCAGWDDSQANSEGRGDCNGIDICGSGFENNGCSNDFIYQTLPDFFCGNFKERAFKPSIEMQDRIKRGE